MPEICHEKEFERLRGEINEIKDAITDINSQLSRLRKGLIDFDKSHFDLLEIHLSRIYPRLVAVEERVLPEIIRDVQAMTQIVGRGDDPDQINPLDRRDDKKA